MEIMGRRGRDSSIIMIFFYFFNFGGVIMRDIVNDFLMRKENIVSGKRKRMVCRDGFSMSVQASKYHYCTPRADKGPWEEVEVGFPSVVEELLIPYAEQPDKQPETVYGYVPVSILEKVIEKHGGLTL